MIASNSPHVTRTHHSTTLTQEPAPRYRNSPGNDPQIRNIFYHNLYHQGRECQWPRYEPNRKVPRTNLIHIGLDCLVGCARRVYSQHDSEAIHGNCFIADSRLSAQPQSRAIHSNATIFGNECNAWDISFWKYVGQAMDSIFYLSF